MARFEGAGALLRFGETLFMMERNPAYKNNEKKAHEIEYPGGKVASPEEAGNPALCARREVLEEAHLVISLEQLWHYVEVKAPSGLYIRLYLVDLTPEQVAAIPEVNRELRKVAEADPSGAECLSLLPVSAKLLKARQTPLPVRKFNWFLIDALILAGML